jgi:hypothetical protein
MRGIRPCDGRPPLFEPLRLLKPRRKRHIRKRSSLPEADRAPAADMLGDRLYGINIPNARDAESDTTTFL